MSIKVNSDITKDSVVQLSDNQFPTAKQVMNFQSSTNTLRYLFYLTSSGTVGGSNWLTFTFNFPYDLGHTNYEYFAYVTSGTAHISTSWLITKGTNRLQLGVTNSYSGSQGVTVRCEFYEKIQLGNTPTVWTGLGIQNQKTQETFGGKAVWKARVINRDTQNGTVNYVFDTSAVNDILEYGGGAYSAAQNSFYNCWTTKGSAGNVGRIEIFNNGTTFNVIRFFADDKAQFNLSRISLWVLYTLVTERAEPSDPKELLRLTEENNK